jgi:hypothetical protein
LNGYEEWIEEWIITEIQAFIKSFITHFLGVQTLVSHAYVGLSQVRLGYGGV